MRRPPSRRRRRDRPRPSSSRGSPPRRRRRSSRTRASRSRSPRLVRSAGPSGPAGAGRRRPRGPATTGRRRRRPATPRRGGPRWPPAPPRPDRTAPASDPVPAVPPCRTGRFTVGRSRPRPRGDWPAGLLDWADERLHLPLSAADLAARAHVSVRTVERRFAEALGMSPLRWVLQQRVRRAQQYLETSDRSAGWLAATCGFGGAAGLRAHFARIVGMSPSAYRRAFHARADPQPLAG
ncbi:helix-turn-helix domain-containing protein [Streptomyces subrutilus]|uniref:helix-turn-helix domain-containing protein n=1 Tax=Streptomyces subrutilus TaxID=36818 RepID=UPI0033D6EA4A